MPKTDDQGNTTYDTQVTSTTNIPEYQQPSRHRLTDQQRIQQNLDRGNRTGDYGGVTGPGIDRPNNLDAARSGYEAGNNPYSGVAPGGRMTTGNEMGSINTFKESYNYDNSGNPLDEGMLHMDWEFNDPKWDWINRQDPATIARLVSMMESTQGEIPFNRSHRPQKTRR